MSQLILNGRTNNTKPDDVLVVNKANRLVVPYINGLAPYDVNINGLNRPPILNGCVFYAPLWHPALSVAPGGTFQSLEASPKTCTVTGALWTPQGRSFDGIDDQILSPRHPSWGNPGNSLTVCVWAKANSLASTPGLAGNFLDGTGRGFHLRFKSTGELDWFVGTGGGTAPETKEATSAAGLITTGKWHFVAGRYDGAFVDVLLNGQVVCTPTAQTGDVYYSNDLLIAKYNNNDDGSGNANPLNGMIGEVLIYNRALSAGEIMRDYQRTKWRYQ
jgi:hypothetical protein